MEICDTHFFAQKKSGNPFQKIVYFRLHWIKEKEISVILRLNDYRVKGDGPRELKLEFRTVAWFFAGISGK